MSNLQDELEGFRRELDELTHRLPLSDSLVADAISRGRRRQHRHRLALAAQGLGVMALVAAVVAGAALWPRSNPREPNRSATEPLSTLAAASSAPAPAAAAPTRAQVSATLARLLAAYGTVTVRSVPATVTTGKGATSLKAPASAIVYLASAHGTVAVAATAITVAHPRPRAGVFACPVGPQVSCHSSRVGDDVVTAVFNPAGSSDSASIWTVLVGHADGRAIQIDEWNGAEPKGAANQRLHGNPPLSLSRLQAIAADPAW